MNKIIFLSFLIPLCAVAQTKDSTALKYASYISTENLKKNLNILASDEYEGRETGKKGQKMAAEYIAEQFKQLGIKPLKSNDYFQHYFLDEKQPGTATFSLNEQLLKQNVDFYYYPTDINKTIIKSDQVTFIGYGIEDSLYNDYKNLDVKNKTIMILSGEPFDKDSFSLVTRLKHVYWIDKLKIKKAKEKGASFILIVKDNVEAEVKKNKQRLESASMILKSKERKTNVVYISKQTAEEILSGKNTIENIEQEILKSKTGVIITVRKKIKIKTRAEQKPLGAENVLGFIEGGELKNEVIVISAHYDHLGIKDGKIYNGADDDGSGTVALIELAKAFSEAKKQGRGPKRSILFIAFSGEEKGLLGSSYYVEHPEIPLVNTVCDLNIDMIGRIDEKHNGNPNYVYLIGSDKLSSDLHNISESVNKTYTQLDLDYTYNDEKDKNRFYYRSDHYNFAKNKVPVIFYFNGVHDDYHQPTDDVEKINFEKIQKISSLVFFTAWELANRTERIRTDSNKK